VNSTKNENNEATLHTWKEFDVVRLMRFIVIISSVDMCLQLKLSINNTISAHSVKGASVNSSASLHV